MNKSIDRLSYELTLLKNQEVKQLTDKLVQMENIVIEDPAKALSLPLIRKDLNGLEENYKMELANTRNEISRVYDQNKWFIGLMFTMAIGLLGLAVSNILQARK